MGRALFFVLSMRKFFVRHAKFCYNKTTYSYRNYIEIVYMVLCMRSLIGKSMRVRRGPATVTQS